MFVLVRLVDIIDMGVDFPILQQKMHDLGEEIGVVIHVMHEDIFNAMHRI